MGGRGAVMAQSAITELAGGSGQRTASSGQPAGVRGQKTEDGGQRTEFRIAKLGTRPKGGSPKDNLEIVGPVTVPAKRASQ
jgi:hypothetical protein